MTRRRQEDFWRRKLRDPSTATKVDFTSGTLTNHVGGQIPHAADGGTNTIVQANLLEGTYNYDEGKTGKTLNKNFGRELYVKYKIKWSADFDFARGMKIARVTAPDSVTQTNFFDYIVVLRSSATNTTPMTDAVDVLCQRNSGSTWASFNWTPVREQWYELQYRWKVESTDGGTDGAFQMWIDGVQKASYSGTLGHAVTGYHSTIESLLFGGWYSNTANDPNPSGIKWQMKDAYYSDKFITA